MPIRPEFRHFYETDEWLNVTRPRILARAGYQCERCGKPDGRFIHTVTGRRLQFGFYPTIEPVMFWSLAKMIETATPSNAGGPWLNHRGEIDDTLWSNGVLIVQTKDRATLELRPMRHVKAQIGVAHANNVAGDDRDENLFAWCNWCHLAHDREHHHETRGARKDAARPLLFGLEIEKAPQPAGGPFGSLHLPQSGGPGQVIVIPS